MVEWTDFERATIQNIFSKIDYDVVGPAALTRCLVVYPWTQRYFAKFGNLYNADAISANPNVKAHGKTVLCGLERAVKNLDNIKAEYTELSVLHSEKLQVDPDNFLVTYNKSECCIIISKTYLGLETKLSVIIFGPVVDRAQQLVICGKESPHAAQ
uniref:Hemoglobin subunit beta-2-like n=1 Tax=Mastacembelus armatus TaxID=205130 RepID=A0A7N9B1G0_9TELE